MVTASTSKSNTYRLMIKKAFILAAGMGTRLGDLTTDKPKALVKVNGKPMIQRVIEELKEYGISEFMINVHHHGVFGTINGITDFFVRKTAY